MFKYVWVHMCVQMHLHMSVNVCRGPKFMLDNFPNCSPFYLLRQALPLNLSSLILAHLATLPWKSTVSGSQVLGLNTATIPARL